MARLYVFADESGNFDFSRKQDASAYFILTTLTTTSCQVGSEVLELRRHLAWEGLGLDREFHATTDQQIVRDRVFAAIDGHAFRLDSTILEKAKAQPHIRMTDAKFYRYAWYYHMRHVMPQIAQPHDEVLVVGASLGTRKQRSTFHDAVRDVILQVSPTVDYRVAYWAAASEPCLQIADYCAWAIQRKWERQDLRSYDLIKDKIKTEYDLFRAGTTVYY
jgi:hypothetical protein